MPLKLEELKHSILAFNSKAVCRRKMAVQSIMAVLFIAFKKFPH